MAASPDEATYGARAERALTRSIVRAATTQNSEARADWATTVYGLVLIGIMFSAIGLSGVHGVMSSLGNPDVAAWAPACLAVASAAGITRFALALGPASAPPAYAGWLLPTPLDRAALLGRRTVSAWAASGVLGALGGATVCVSAGTVTGVGLAQVIGIGAVGGAALAALASGLQARAWSSKAAKLCDVVAFLAALVIAVGGSAGLSMTIGMPGPVLWAIVVSSLVLLLVCAMRLSLWLRATRIADVLRPGRFLAAARTTTLTLDATSLALLGRPGGSSSSTRSKVRAPRNGVAVWLDCIAMGRRWKQLASRAAALVVPIAIDVVVGPTAATFALAVLLLPLATTATTNVRLWLESSSLWRMLPGSTLATTARLCVAPTAMVSAIGVVAAMLAHLTWMAGAALAVASLAVQIKRTRRPAMQLGAVMPSMFGDIPLGVATAVFYGYEIMLLVLVVGLVVGWPAGLVVALGWLTIALTLARPDRLA